MVALDLRAETPDLDEFFTLERMTLIERSLEDVEAGDVFTIQQVKEDIAKARDQWLRPHRDAQ